MALVAAALPSVGVAVPQDPFERASFVYDGPAHGDDGANDISLSPDGSRAYVTGVSDGGSTSFDYATVAYDIAGGVAVWSARYNGPANRIDAADSIVTSPDGSKVFVSGRSEGPTGYDWATLAYNAGDGSLIWVSRYNGLADTYDHVEEMKVSPDGNRIFVAGWSASTSPSDSSSDYLTIAYDSATGARLWEARYAGAPRSIDTVRDLAVSPDGSTIYVTGKSGRLSIDDAEFDYLKVAYSSITGIQLWEARFNGSGNKGDFPASIAVTPDGGTAYVVGTTWGTGDGVADAAGYDIGVVAYDTASGAQVSSKVYESPAGLQAWAVGMAMSPDGRKLYVAGKSAFDVSQPPS